MTISMQAMHPTSSSTCNAGLEARAPKSNQTTPLSWPSVISLVATHRLSGFYRLPSSLSNYQAHLSRVQSQYDSIQAYVLAELLHWDLDERLSGWCARDSAELDREVKRRPAEVIVMEGCAHDRGRSTVGRPQNELDGSGQITLRCSDEVTFRARKGDYQVLITPFPYAVPSEAIHYIVWSKSPILHPCAISTTFSPRVRLLAWRYIQTHGLSGLHNCVSLINSNGNGTGSGLSRSASLKELALDQEEEDQVRAAIVDAGKDLRSFVETRWGQEYEAVWFANPPSLQSIPDLAHFHCIARRKDGS